MMALSPQALSARHRLLVEVGDAGVARLGASTARVTPLGPTSSAVARAYLERAGVAVEGQGEGVDEPAVTAYLRGAHFALEHFLRTVGVGESLPLSALIEATRAETAHDD